MTTRQLDRRQWQTYFDQISQHLEATRINLEITGPDLGVQTEAQHVTLQGLSYDPKDDAFSVISEELEHRIEHPEAISVREDAGGLSAVEIIDGDNRHHIARLISPLRLPPSSRPGR